ncbi:MAG: MBL fold metallo-hydrolase [Parvibaculum sp.]|uniref:MBL fold metallo-hydrolase n=1 Tax=Parvibaculum sp. TaxID=2024848 RepID=UPI00283DCC29|nr:MBL fold metallo-hydrolase [Parvibaculum sp.]MDR3498519.1 MBL fold metallo-hydrolase [Parvibaculum sp.]
MKRIAIAVGALAALFLVAFGALWVTPSLQDGVMKRVVASRLGDGDRAALLNDGALHIVLCGTGSPMPDLSRANACTAVVAGGHVVIIDTGPRSWSRFAEARIPASAIDAILLTHLHSDHIGDLGEFAVQSWIAGRKTPLEIYGPGAPQEIKPPLDAEGHAYGTEGTVDVVKGFADAYGTDSGFRLVHHGVDFLAPEGARMIGHDIAKMPLETATTVYDKDGLKISAFLVNHHPIEPAFGYRIEYKGRVAVVSGDTKKFENVAYFAKDADLLVHEALSDNMVRLIASGLDGAGNKRLAKMARDTINYHTSPVEAAEIAKEANVRLLVFSHIVPPLPNALARHMFFRGVEAARGAGETMLGYDDLMISLPGGSTAIQTTDLR